MKAVAAAVAVVLAEAAVDGAALNQARRRPAGPTTEPQPAVADAGGAGRAGLQAMPARRAAIWRPHRPRPSGSRS